MQIYFHLCVKLDVEVATRREPSEERERFLP